MQITSLSRANRIGVFAGVALSLSVAAVTRLGWLGLIEFKNDESWALSIGSSIARGQTHPLVGIGSSLGLPNAPFFVYLMALPELLSRDPSVATAVIGLLGVAAVGITYGFGRSLADDVAGISAALLFAVSPWGIIFSRKVWEQDALPAFVGLGMLGLFAALRDDRRRLIAPSLGLLTLAVQLHPTALTLAVPAAILVAACLLADRADPGRTLRWFALGVIVSAFLEAPFVIWQLRHGWLLPDAIRHLSSGPARFDATPLLLAASVATSNGYPTLAFVADSWGPSRWIELTLLVVGVVLLARWAWRAAKRNDRLVAIAFIAWLVAPIIAQTRHSVDLYPHYFIVLFPAPFIAMGIATSALWNVGRRVRWRSGTRRDQLALAAKAATVLAIAIPVGLGTLSFERYIRALANGAERPEFGVPLASQQALLSEANRVAAGGPVYLGAHDDLAPSLEYLGDGRVRAFDDRIGLLLPAGNRSAAVLLSDRHSTAATILHRVAGGPMEIVTLRPGYKVEVFRLTSLASPGLPGFQPVNATFDNGITLISYRIAATPEPRTVDVGVIFHLTGSPPNAIPTAFNHLLAGDGHVVAQEDRPAYVPLDWRDGDSIMSEFLLSWPSEPGPYTLEFGLYEFPGMQRHRLLLQPTNGSPDSLILGPIDLSAH